MTAADLWAAIARVRQAQSRNPDTMLICDALEKSLLAIASNPEAKPVFNRNGYQRQYMRDMRAAKKAGMTTEAYRAQKADQ